MVWRYFHFTARVRIEDKVRWYESTLAGAIGSPWVVTVKALVGFIPRAAAMASADFLLIGFPATAWLMVARLTPDDLEKAARAPRWVPIWARRSSLQTAVTRFRTPLSWRFR